MDSKFIISTQTCTLSKEQLEQFLCDYDIPRHVRVILSKKSETIYDAPLGFVGLYTHHFSLSNLRLPIPLFICDVLSYFKAYGGEPSVDLLRSFLNLGRAGNYLNRGGADVPKALIKPVTHLEIWKGLKTSWEYIPKRPVIYHHGEGTEMDFRSFMIQGVDGEFNFLPEGGFKDNQGSFSTKSVNNETPILDAEPISAVLPANVVDNIIDSSNTSYDDELPPVHPPTSSIPKASKVTGDASTPLDVDSDPDIHEFPSAKELKDATDYHWVVAHVTPPSWKQHLRDISIDQLCDIHDRAYMRHAVLDNILNIKTRELISALLKARASCDAIREREVKRDNAYAEIEKKCNEALQDLDKNPLVFDMRSEIKTLQVQVNGLHNEYGRLLEIDRLRQDRAAVVSKVIPNAKMKLVHSDEMGVLVARLVRAAIVHGRCTC
ncbi:hypothetical protein Tco_0884417 [Tanacetum coccineum]